MDQSDSGGQMDVRFPNGAQCTFGGKGASFIQLLVSCSYSNRPCPNVSDGSIEPALHRFCLRCCSTANDQVNCNSHRDRLGCENAIPGKYDFPERGLSCA